MALSFNRSAQVKPSALWNILFFKEDEKVVQELDEQRWMRTRIYMYITAILVAFWGVFDVFIDFENLWIFLALRAVYTPLTLLWAYFFHISFFRNNHEKWAMVHYFLLILDIGIMVLWTDNFVKYLIGFSTIFWGTSVIMLWRFWNTVIPGLLVILIAYIRFAFFPHNVAEGEFITGLYYFMTCLTFTSIISAYGYWTAYQLQEKNLTLIKTQEKLIQAEKMASLNTVVASIAHEINTPIGTAITASSHTEEQFNRILNALKLGEIDISSIRNPALDGLNSSHSALSELQRTATLVERLKSSAVDQSSFDERDFNIREYICENVVELGLRPILKPLKISATVTGDDIFMHSYPGEISQIFTNLIMNSIHHGFWQHTVQEPTINIQVKRQGNHVLIHYSDNGRGMNKDVMHKIFDPFFTTKGSKGSAEGRGHKGSGLGMSIVYNSVTQKLHGSINVDSQVGLGTFFTLSLPIYPPSESKKVIQTS